MKTSGKVCGQDLSAGRNSVASAVEPGHGQTPKRTHENGHWTLGYADYTAILISGKLLEHDLRTSSRGSGYATAVVWQNSVVCQSTNDDDNAIQQKEGFKGPKGTLAFSGDTLKLTAEVKYLALVMDMVLTWEARLINVMTKDCGAFWICRGTFGKTCSLTTKVVYWTYTMVIRPMLTNGFTVWWLGVTYKVRRAELGRVHRLASLTITGRMA